jgi:hypothetical protein
MARNFNLRNLGSRSASLYGANSSPYKPQQHNMFVVRLLLVKKNNESTNELPRPEA